MKHEIAKILDIADRTVYKWKKEERPIISFLYQYFSKEDLQEYLKQGRMKRLEVIKNNNPINSYDFHILSIILYKVEEYTKNEKVNREGFLIKLYRTIRDFENTPSKFPIFLENYNMKTLESLRNVVWGASLEDVKKFFLDDLSRKEQEVLFLRKLYLLPPLKSMRKHNAHLKD